jgi:branched-chain amino acid transport system permease protein
MGLFAAAFNLLFGFGGMLSFGHAAFFGVGAYLTAYAMKTWGFTPELALLASVAASALLGTLFGWLAIRRQGIYFAMVTLALAQMLFFFFAQAPFAGAEDGIQGVPRGRLFGLVDLERPLAIYLFVLAVCFAGFAFLYRFVHSPFGQVLRAIRDNEARATSLGYDVERCKLAVFVVSAALAGLAGGAKTLVVQLVTLADVHWALSGEVILMVLVGGLGTLLGPAIGAFLLVGLDVWLAESGVSPAIAQGLLFIFCVLALRRGLWGFVEDFLGRISGER